MKIHLLFLSFLLILGCSSSEEEKWCELGIEEARSEIQKEGLVLVKNSSMGVVGRFDKELKILLKDYNIRFRYQGACGILPRESYIQKCYNQTMAKNIENKFGKGFIQKLCKQADINFANQKNYLFADFELDEKPYFINPKGKDFSDEELIKHLNKYLEYPENYTFAKAVHERPYVTVNFIVDNKGMPTNFSLGYSKFSKEKKKFKTYFETEVLQIISKIPKWEPGTIHGKKVNSKFTRTIPLDWII